MTQEITRSGFIWTHLGVITVVIIATIGGAVAWGQTQQKVDNLREQQERIDTSLNNLDVHQRAIQSQQQQDTNTLGALDERSKNAAESQRRILDAIERLDERLDNAR